MPAAKPEIVELTPVPDVVTPPGLRVNVQVPVAGKPFKTTLPVARAQVGCVVVPTEGAVGVAGCALITTLVEGGDVTEVELVTVKV